MIIIHADCLEDTKPLKIIYKDIENITLLYNPKRKELEEELKRNPDPVIMFLGHGERNGFYEDYRGEENLLDKNNVDLVKDRTVVGIWCYASEFADFYGLHGFFTSMFISNWGEYDMLGMCGDYTESTILKELNIFCIRLNEFLKNNTPMKEWPELLQKACDKEKDFVRFNYEALVYYD